MRRSAPELLTLASCGLPAFAGGTAWWVRRAVAPQVLLRPLKSLRPAAYGPDGLAKYFKPISLRHAAYGADGLANLRHAALGPDGLVKNLHACLRCP